MNCKVFGQLKVQLCYSMWQLMT